MKNCSNFLYFLSLIGTFHACGEELTFSDREELLLAPTALSNSISGDFDGDGDLDTVFHSSIGIVFCENTGDPDSPEISYLSFAANRGTSTFDPIFQVALAAAPINGDDKDDLLVAQTSSLAFGNSPVLKVIKFFPATETTRIGLFVDDLFPLFDQQSLPKIFVGQFTRQQPTGGLEIFDELGFNRSAANTANRTVRAFGGTGLIQAVSDLDGDGWTDIISEGIIWRNSNGAGFINTGTTFEGNLEDLEEPVLDSGLVKAPSIEGSELIAFDADGDGDLDLGYDSGSSIVTVSNDGNGNFVYNEDSPAASDPQDASVEEAEAVRDFNGDGLIDLLEETPRNRDGLTGLTVSLAQSDGSFSPAITLADEMAFQDSLVTDYDGDGDADILFSHQEFFFVGSRETINPPVFVKVFLNDGNGTFTLEQEVQLSEEIIEPTNPSFNVSTQGFNTVEDVKYLDFDGDGTLDIFARYRFSFRIFTAEGEGFTSEPTFGFDQGFFALSDVIFGDFNDDQRLDIAALDARLDGVYLYLNEADMPVVSVDVETIREDGGSFAVTFTLDRPATTFAGFNFELEPGTATADEDFGPAPTNFIGFAVGESTTTQYFHILDDSILEGDETFFLRFSNAFDLVLSEDTIPLTIIDDEVPTLIVTNEVATEGDVDFPISFRLSEPATESISISVTAESGSAIEGSDYVLAERGGLLFFEGATTPVRTFPPAFGTIIDDFEPEDDESFVIRLSSSSAVSIPQETFTITIQDDDVVPDFPFEGAESLSYTFSAEVTSNLSGGFYQDSARFAEFEDLLLVEGPLGEVISGAFEVSVADLQLFDSGTSGGTTYFHQNGLDSISTFFTSAQEIVIPPTNIPAVQYSWEGLFDFTLEPNTSRFTSTSLNFSSSSQSFSQSRAILFNDLSVPDSGMPFFFGTNIGNESGGTVPFAPSNTPNSDGVRDFVDAADFPLSPAVGVGDSLVLKAFQSTEREGVIAREVMFLVFNKEDGSLFEEGEFPSLDLADLTLAKVLFLTQNAVIRSGPVSTTWSYREADITSLTNSNTPAGDGLPQLTVDAPPTNEGLIGQIVTFTLSQPAATEVSVMFDTVAGSANPQEDFFPYLNGLVTFQPGETEQTIQLTFVDDAVIEPNETFVLELSNPDGLLLPESNPEVTIINDDSVFDDYGVQFGFSVAERRIFADGDHDGIGFFLEYTFNLNPTVAESPDYVPGPGVYRR